MSKVEHIFGRFVKYFFTMVVLFYIKKNPERQLVYVLCFTVIKMTLVNTYVSFNGIMDLKIAKSLMGS